MFTLLLQRRSLPRGSRTAALLVMLALLSACSTLPPQVASPPTAAIAEYAQTPLALMTDKAMAQDGRSGFRLLPYGPNAFAARIALARLATRSLDVQYYLLQRDDTGLALMRALRDAAARGVRVRLLIDDLYTAGSDELLLALASYPNVQVRLFNPFPAWRDSMAMRFVASAFDFNRVNRRMHNKLFVADNAAAVAGGRNIADEYMMNAKGSNFVDMDIFAAGPVGRDLSDAFDHYWNSEVVYPIAYIARSAAPVALLQARFEQRTLEARPPQADEISADGRYTSPTTGEAGTLLPAQLQMLNLPFELARGLLSPLVAADGRVLFDPLTKTTGLNESAQSSRGTVTERVVQWLRTARSDIKMVSPYFVPSESAVASLGGAHKAGVHVLVMTNSLASTDEPWVYVGYSAHLKELLRSGVEVKELSPTLTVKRRKLGIFGHRTGALHMKNAILDHRQVFLGSMNLDHRSALINTELGLIIDSVDLARQIEEFSDAHSSYLVRLTGDGRDIEWVEEDDDGKQTLFQVPPETSGWQRFKLMLLGPFIPEREL